MVVVFVRVVGVGLADMESVDWRVGREQCRELNLSFPTKHTRVNPTNTISECRVVGLRVLGQVGNRCV